MFCHHIPEVLLIGPPNVGKSVIFNHLTGSSVSIANYAGTTVDLARGTGRFGSLDASILDLPGTYTLAAANEAEEVATGILRLAFATEVSEPGVENVEKCPQRDSNPCLHLERVVS